MSIRPLFASERYGSGPFRNCRGSSIFFGVMLATDNEAGLNDFGRHVGQKGRTRVLRQMWRAFETQVPADDNGWADQGDVLLMQRAIWPHLPLPRIAANVDGEAVWEAIGPNAVSLAIYPAALPMDDPVRRYVGPVSHQGVAWKTRTKNGRRQVKWMCPMRPSSNVYTGHWVDWQSLRKAAQDVPVRLGAARGGTFYHELYPVGAWTAEALRVNQWAQAVKRQRELKEAANEKLLVARLEIEALRTALEEHQESDPGWSKAAGWESALVRIIEQANELRTEGP